MKSIEEVGLHEPVSWLNPVFSSQLIFCSPLLETGGPPKRQARVTTE